MSAAQRCSRCGAALAAGQEYCVECGTRHTSAAPHPFHWLWPAAAAALIAAGGAAGAIAAGADDGGDATIVALTPLRPATQSAEKPAKLRLWPRRGGYTIVLAALPTTVGAKAAQARALSAAGAGVPDVGVLASSRYASLHPGYWIVFSGVYRTLDEALAGLPRAARYARTAYAQQITR